MDINVRQMTIEDIEAVAAIEAACFSEPWSPNSFRSSLERKDSIFFVALDEEKIIGYLGFYYCMGEADITNIAVSEAYRRCGAADLLLGSMLIICQKKNLQLISLEVRKSNTPAIKLYEKYGFKEVGVRKDFYRKPTEDGLVMNKYIEYEEI